LVWSWDEFLAADLGDVAAWITPSVRDRVPQSLAQHAVGTEEPLRHGIDSFVVIGGGTLIDEAKLLVRQSGRPVKLIAVPTIWGSGAEVSPVVVVNRDGKKLIHVGEEYLPDRVVDWPAVAATIGGSRAREACGDSWAHALEGFTSPLAPDELRRELADVMRDMLALPLGNDTRWFELSRRACAGQARSSVGLVHGIAHTLEGPLNQAEPAAPWHHARLCALYLLPVISFNTHASDKWLRLAQQYELDVGAIGQVLAGLFDLAAYQRTLPLLEQHWRDVIRDRCTRTNCALVRADSLEHFRRPPFSL
jgi:alcohol dehydrogenase class IV